MFSTLVQIQFQLNRQEYGLSKEAKLYNVQFNPQDYGITKKYDDVQKIYQVDEAATVVTLTTDKETNQVSFGTT